MVGVMTRESVPSVGRRPGELERVYVEIFDRFARMIAAGEFPFGAEDIETEDAPRVGDGVLLLDAVGARRVRLAQRRVGPAPHGHPLQPRGRPPRRARARRVAGARAPSPSACPITEEIERGPVDARPACHPAASSTAELHGRGRAAARRLGPPPARPPAASPRTPPSARCTTGSRTTCRRSRRCCACRAGGWRAPRPRPPSRSRCAASARSRSCTRRCRGRPARRWSSTRSCGRWCGWWRRGCCRPSSRCASPSRATPASCGPRWRRRWRSCSPSCSRTRCEHAFPEDDATPADPQVRVTIEQRRRRAGRARARQRRRACPPGFSVDDATSLGLTIVRALVTTELARHHRDAHRRRHPRRPPHPGAAARGVVDHRFGAKPSW